MASDSMEKEVQKITFGDLNLGNCFAILTKRGCEDDSQKVSEACKTPDELLNMMTIEGWQNLGISSEGIEVLKDIKKGLYTSKIVNDPIHGHIELHPLCVKIIDTPQFQRLRYLKQMGAKYFVYPGASHNRFEHSLGVCYLAGEFASILKQRHTDLKILDDDILCVQIAGLCHDLGHGPFSHMFDNSFLPRFRDEGSAAIKHEDLSVKMFDHLVQDNKLTDVFKKYGLNETDMDFIKHLINPPPATESKTGRENKEFLHEIVSNKRNGIDVDKWDYFARDCQMLGIKNNFDHRRCMQFARVLNVNGKRQICFRDKEGWNLYEMFHTRNILHRIACQHRVGNIIEAMITEAMLKANDHIQIPGENGKPRRISETVGDMHAYQKLTDDIFHQILWSGKNELENAKEILMNIEQRKLYKCIGQVRPPLNQKFDENIFFGFAKEKGFEKKDFIIHAVTIDYGMGDQNPIDFVYFYTKSDPTKPIPVQKSEVSRLLTDTFAEQLIEVYCKKRDEESLKEANDAFKEWVKKSEEEKEQLEMAKMMAEKLKEIAPVPSTQNLSVKLKGGGGSGGETKLSQEIRKPTVMDFPKSSFKMYL